ncbi:pentatricopeptide repeat-containing protein At2g13600-like [Durio zibethinus]|uniref:Pentatricopeptide repeat-containing protein At2g13600-like n=1 Tax=Durio zibethinus TaxID=66656 RepID=A0A6P5XKF5_DURZI|nr:pentatricopeptide repeat-containing protein At2g13600-like [Durio zibethinus]
MGIFPLNITQNGDFVIYYDNLPRTKSMYGTRTILLKQKRYHSVTTSLTSSSFSPALFISQILTANLFGLLKIQNACNPQPNSLSCQTQIFNYKENQLNLLDLEHFCQFHQHGSFSSPLTLSKIISFCGKSASLNTGIQLQSTVIKMGFASNLYIQGALIDMYGENSGMFSAQKLFDGIPDRNVIGWNTLISGYVHVNSPELAVEQFIKLLRTGKMKIDDQFIFNLCCLSDLKGCVSQNIILFISNLKYIESVHGTASSLELVEA